MMPRILLSLLGCCIFLPLAVTAIHGQRRPSWSNGRRLGLHHDVDRNSIFATSTTSLLDVNDDTHVQQMGQTNAVPIYPSIPRGGACSDSTPRLFAKIALGAAVETSLMYALIDLIITLKSNNRHSGNSTAMIAIFQTIVLLSIIFGSSTFGAIVDRGLSAATKQILDPNQIPGDANWYANLKKPRWNPPGWLFPIMWLIVSKPTQFMAVTKLLAAASSNTNKKELSIPLLAYCTHLSLGDAWNKVFFGLECTGRGLAVIFTFWSALWLCAYLFGRKDRIAGLLLLPTCLWVTVATILNWSIYRLNRQE